MLLLLRAAYFATSRSNDYARESARVRCSDATELPFIISAAQSRLLQEDTPCEIFYSSSFSKPLSHSEGSIDRVSSCVGARGLMERLTVAAQRETSTVTLLTFVLRSVTLTFHLRFLPCRRRRLALRKGCGYRGGGSLACTSRPHGEAMRQTRETRRRLSGRSDDVGMAERVGRRTVSKPVLNCWPHRSGQHQQVMPLLSER